jgi:hypothetical protein
MATVLAIGPLRDEAQGMLKSNHSAGLGTQPEALKILVAGQDKRLELAQPGREDIAYLVEEGTKKARPD